MSSLFLLSYGKLFHSFLVKDCFLFRNIEVEEEVKFVQKVAGVVRSTRADYNLPNKTKTELYLQVFCQKSAQVGKKC